MRDTSGRLYYGWFVLAAVSGMTFANGATAIAVLLVWRNHPNTYGLVRGPIAALAHWLTGLYLPQRTYKGISHWIHNELLRCLIHTLRWNTKGQCDHEHNRPQHSCHYAGWS